MHRRTSLFARPLALSLTALLALAACGDDVASTGSGGGTGTGTTGASSSTGTTTAPTATGPSSGTSDDSSSSTSDTSGSGGSGTGGAGQGGETDATSTGAGAGPEGSFTAGPADREVEVLVPASYEHGTPTPLVILLHGYSVTGAIQDAYFQMTPLAEEYGFLLAAPDGTVDSFGENFWNATEACCNFDGSDVDDSAYLQGLVDEISDVATIDPKRIYFVGHSNGGFMSYRMACEHADTIAAIASFAGATFADENDCNPSEPVAALQIHGTADETILYAGGAIFGNPYPSAPQTVETWAAYDGCTLSPTEGEPRDLSVSGIPATVAIYDQGCDPHGSAELWTMPGESHSPIPLGPTFTRQIVEWLLAHPKP